MMNRADKIFTAVAVYLFVTALVFLFIAPMEDDGTFGEKEKSAAIALTWPVHAIVLSVKGIWYLLTLLFDGVLYAF